MGQSMGQIQNPFAGSSFGAPTPDLMSNANLAQIPDATFGTGVQPVGVGVAGSLDASNPMGAGQMTDLSSPMGMGGAMPMTPSAQVSTGVAKTGTDWKGMAKGLGEGLIAYKKVQEATKKEAPKMTPLDNKPNQVPLQIGMAANQMAPQSTASGAMQAIMGGMSPQNRQLGIMNLIGK